MTTTDLRRRLAQLDAQILGQRAVLVELERNRVDVERDLWATATFPVVALPIEITTEIFLWCLPEHEDTFEVPQELVWHKNQGESRLNPRAPLALASVCRRWRAIALSAPELWSMLDCSFPHKIMPEEAMQEMQRWLDRATSRSLTINLRAWYGRWVDESLAQNLRHLIHAYSETIQHLELIIPPQVVHQLGLDSCRFPRLRSTRLGMALDDTLAPGHIFTNAPLLHEVRLSNYEATLPYYILPWLQLTRFNGQIDTMDLFTFAPNLTEVICSMEWIDEPTSVIIHPRLQSLTLAMSENNVKPDDTILRHLTLPALQSLDISKMDDTRYPSLTSFLHRSSPLLLALSIRPDNVGFRDWVDCFDCIDATLETLTLKSPAEAVQQFLYFQKPAPFPNLHTLNIVNLLGLNYSGLLQCLHERPNLRSFRLSFTQGIFLDDKYPSKMLARYAPPASINISPS
ncbi:hypothetical protein FB451DRAFT_1562706 [Mycena latifolia]|nr:hypothetical protein FB451DRAFT_1562706 [Mycena latifolia]